MHNSPGQRSQRRPAGRTQMSCKVVRFTTHRTESEVGTKHGCEGGARSPKACSRVEEGVGARGAVHHRQTQGRPRDEARLTGPSARTHLRRVLGTLAGRKDARQQRPSSPPAWGGVSRGRGRLKPRGAHTSAAPAPRPARPAAAAWLAHRAVAPSRAACARCSALLFLSVLPIAEYKASYCGRRTQPAFAQARQPR